MTQNNQANKKAYLKHRLAGLPTPKNITHDMMRVNHAGELGAVYIYKGQMKSLGYKSDTQSLNMIQDMSEQEVVHLNHFNKILPEQRIRPSVFSPFWILGGFCMGAGTASISKDNAMLCTKSVETVIGDHYQQQIDYFNMGKIYDTETLELFKNQELDHLNHAVHDGANQAKFYHLSDTVIQLTCKIVINIAEKL